MGKLNDLFQGIQANDSKDLILFLYETIHNTLNNPKYTVSFNTNNSVFNQFANNYFSQNQSLPIDLFYFTQSGNVKCKNCQFNKISYNIANFCFFPLEKIRVWKEKHKNSTSPVTIDDCFEHFKAHDELIGDNQIYCNNCQQSSDAETWNAIHTAPQIFTCIINRGKGLQYDDIRTNFAQQFTIREDLSDTDVTYDLQSFVIHLGESGMGGHFITVAKGLDGKWYSYNDTQVNQISNNDVLDYLNGQIGRPYILFYKKVKDNIQYNNNNNMVFNNMNNMQIPMWNMNGMNAMGMNMNMNGMNNNMMQNMNYNNNLNCNSNNCMHQHNNNVMPQNQMLNNARFMQQNNNGMNFANNNNNLNNMNKFSNNVQNNNMNYNNNANYNNNMQNNFNNMNNNNNNRVNKFNNNNFNNNNKFNKNGRSNSAPSMQNINRGKVNQMNMRQINNNQMRNNSANNNNYNNNQNFNNNFMQNKNMNFNNNMQNNNYNNNQNYNNNMNNNNINNM